MTRRCQTTGERAIELVTAAWGNCEAQESEYAKGRVRVTLTVTDARGWRAEVVNVTGKGVNEAWAKAMRDARRVAEARIPHFDARIAQAELDASRERAARLRLFDVLNSDGTTEAP